MVSGAYSTCWGKGCAGAAVGIVAVAMVHESIVQTKARVRMVVTRRITLFAIRFISSLLLFLLLLLCAHKDGLTASLHEFFPLSTQSFACQVRTNASCRPS